MRLCHFQRAGGDRRDQTDVPGRLQEQAVPNSSERLLRMARRAGRQAAVLFLSTSCPPVVPNCASGQISQTTGFALPECAIDFGTTAASRHGLYGFVRLGGRLSRHAEGHGSHGIPAMGERAQFWIGSGNARGLRAGGANGGGESLRGSCGRSGASGGEGGLARPSRATSYGFYLRQFSLERVPTRSEDSPFLMQGEQNGIVSWSS
jgi:hypothetical protein